MSEPIKQILKDHLSVMQLKENPATHRAIATGPWIRGLSDSLNDWHNAEVLKVLETIEVSNIKHGVADKKMNQSYYSDEVQNKINELRTRYTGGEDASIS